MRLHRLELEGFGPFRERQVVDFDAFAGDGIFLIAGRTGAGKSSILDGVCFALYGGVPRYDGGEKRLRSDHCDPEDRTEVVLDFSLGDARWRLTRAPEYERPKRRGGGSTTEGARAQLDELVEGEWVGRASGPREVGLALDDVLGLTQQQFLQVILLAQNRFARFLLARNDERQALLRTLFGTRTYEDYQDALDARRKAAEAAVASEMSAVELLLDEAERLVAAGDALGPADEESGDAEASAGSGEEDASAEPAPTSAPMGITERIGAVARAAGLARARADALAAARDAAEAERAAAEGSHTALLALHERVMKRGRARAAVTALEADAPAVEADRVALRRAEDAEALRASLEAADRAAAALIAAQAAEQAARADWAAVGGDVDAGADELRSTAEELTGHLAVWSVVAERERTLTELDQRLSALTARADALVAAVSELDERRRAVPARLDALDAELRDVTAVAGTLASARARVAETEAGRAAAEDAARRAEEQREAESRHAVSSAAAAAAASAVADLLRRRLADHAGELAEALVAGEACAVCGSLEHPVPAVRTDEPVTDAELTAAEKAKDAATAADRATGDAARAARSAHAEAAARAGGQSPEQWEEAAVAAREALAVAERAERDRDRLRAERDAIVALDAEAEAERTGLAAELAAAREEIAAVGEQAGAAASAVTEARGSFETVAERMAAAERHRRAAHQLIAALEDVVARGEAARAADADRDARLADAVFADAGEASAALRPAEERARLDERIRSHEASLAAQRALLLDLEVELSGVGEDLPDPAESERILAEVRAAARRAVDAAAHAEQTTAALRSLVTRAQAAHDGIADVAAEAAAVARLANTVAGRAPNTRRMTLETFVLAAELEEIVAAANLRLEEMSSGRYRLQHSDARASRNGASGLGIEVMDAYTGQARPAQSLSGGETFLASLALALGLAEVVTSRAGGIRLDTLFIDEGFGSLDAETLDIAMTTLDALRQGGRIVGVISHVETMKEQLPAQLTVVAGSHGPSVIQQDAVVPQTA